MTFEDYLHTNHAPASVKRYSREVKLYSLEMGNIETSTYNDIIDYLNHRRKTLKNISPCLNAIKNYYSYLVKIGRRKDNPALSIFNKDKKVPVQLQDLFTEEELEKLLDVKERYTILTNRNKSIVSLLIYQALTNENIRNLELKNINFDKGTVYIRSERNTNSRTLQLNPRQVYWLMNYISSDRPKMLKSPTNKLFISKLGKEENGEGIGYLIERCKGLFPDRKLNPKTIRQSVITNLLKKNDVRVVQVFAGHKYPSTTEKYITPDLQGLKTKLEQLHPLNGLL